MKNILRLLAGLTCFFFFVAQPIQANLIAALTSHYSFAIQDKVMLLSRSSDIDPCEENILTALGDAYVMSKNPTMGTVIYGKAMLCSPGNSLIRFKFGQALFMMGFNGIDNMKDALRLEPHNPVYQAEFDRISTALQSQSQ